jgi:hypothetical protein
LIACTVSKTTHTKSKRLPIDGPLTSILCFLYAQCRIEKARALD